jgi:kynurenine formamidase
VKKHGEFVSSIDASSASEALALGAHVGTHIDSLRHLREDAGGPEAIPLDYCYGDGVCLDFRHLEKGAGISRRPLQKIGNWGEFPSQESSGKLGDS